MNQRSNVVSAPYSAISEVRQVAPQRFTATVRESWYTGRGAFGGLVAGLFARALRSALSVDADPGQLRTLTCHLCEPVPAGACSIVVELLRVGKYVSHASARLQPPENGARTLAAATATFTRRRPGETLRFDRAKMPEHLPLGSTPQVLNSGREPVFTRNFVYHFAGGQAPFSAGDVASFVGWTRYGGPAGPLDDALAAAYLDAWPPAVFAMSDSPRPAATMAITYHFVRALPDTETEAGASYLVTASALEAVDGYSAQDNELWSPDGRLLARAHQVFALIK